MDIDPGLEDAWAVLGLGADADRDQVTSAYRRLARATHPDVSPTPDAAARFAAVAHAYRRAVEATRRQETEPRSTDTTPRKRSSTSGTGPASGQEDVWIYVSTPMVQDRFCTDAGETILPLSGRGGPGRGHSSPPGSAPIVAGPVHVQPAGSSGPARSERKGSDG
jgi:DnaJ-class molecular chaperone